MDEENRGEEYPCRLNNRMPGLGRYHFICLALAAFPGFLPCIRRQFFRCFFRRFPRCLALGRYASRQLDCCLGTGRAYHLIEQAAGQDDGGQHEPAFRGQHALAKDGQWKRLPGESGPGRSNGGFPAMRG